MIFRSSNVSPARRSECSCNATLTSSGITVKFLLHINGCSIRDKGVLAIPGAKTPFTVVTFRPAPVLVDVAVTVARQPGETFSAVQMSHRPGVASVAAMRL